MFHSNNLLLLNHGGKTKERRKDMWDRDAGLGEWAWVFMGWVGSGWVGHFIQPNPNQPIPFLKVDFDG
jgi:hypothetical protein